MGAEQKEKKLYTLAEVLDIIPMSQSGIYKACNDGKIPSTRIGKRVFIPAWYINSITNEPIQA